MKILRSFAVALAAFFYVGTASAQWQTPNYSVPIGRGAGTGFKFAAPGATGLALISNGASSDPSFQGITGATFGAQSANTHFSGPASGAAANPSFRALVGADLPNPSASTLGGVQSKAATSNQFLTAISTSGVPASAQPAFTDISGTATATQGGTGLSTFAVGDLLYAATTSTLARLADVATGNVLRSGGVGVAPAWGKVALSTDVSGTLQAAQFPALTGDVTTSAGALATTLATVNSNVGSFGGASAVPNFTVSAKGLITAAGSQAYQDGTNAAKGVVRGDGTTITCVAGVCTSVGSAATSIAVGTTTITGGSSGDDLYNNAGVLGSRTRSNPTQQIYLSGSGTFNTPAGATWLRVRGVGGGGGGAGSGSAGGTAAGTGGTTTFGSSVLTALGGVGGTINSTGGAGGAKTTFAGSPLPVGQNFDGGDGGAGGGIPAATNATINGGNGGNSCYSGAGSGGGGTGLMSATAGKANTGGGGGGGAANTTGNFAASGGGAGACFDAIISTPSASYAYAAGAAGTAGGAGSGGQAGGAGGSGGIWVEVHYGP